MVSYGKSLSCVLLLVCSGCGNGSGLSGDAQSAMQAVAAGLAESQPDIIWEALPPSYRSDLGSLVHEFGARVDPQTYDQVFGLVRKVAGVLERKREYVLGSKLAAGKIDQAEFRTHWTKVVRLLELIAQSELSTSASLHTLDVGAFLQGSGRDIMAQLAELGALANDDPFDVFRTMSVQQLTDSRGVTTLRLAPSGGIPQSVDFIRVEGRWVPRDMADGWQEMVMQARAGLESMPIGRDHKGRMQARMFLSMVGSMIDQLAAADSQKKFDELIAGMLGGFGGMAASPGK